MPGTKEAMGKKFNLANAVQNTAANNSLKALHILQHDPEYKDAVAKYKEEASKKEPDKTVLDEFGKRIGNAKSAAKYTEYDQHAEITACKHHYRDQLGIDECQKLVSRAFSAVEQFRTGKAKKVHYKHWYDDTSIEGKSSKSSLKYAGNRCIQFGKGNLYPLIVKKDDKYAEEALTHKVKYVRLVRRTVRGKRRYFAQLVLEGIPPKTKNLRYGRKDSHVGLDEGVSTLAVASRKEVSLYELAPGTSTDERELRRLNRAIDRSKRVMNPENYNEDGTIKKGRKKWKKSKRCQRLESQRRELYRRSSCKRKCAHNQLANHIVSLGLDIRVEDMRIQALAKRTKKTTVNKSNGKINSKKRFGKTIMARAPATLINAIDRKLGYAGHAIKKIDTFKVKASQYDHKSNTYKKKRLADREHVFRDGTKVQRDLYSAFLVMNTTRTLDGIDRKACVRNYKVFKELQDAAVLEARKNPFLRWYTA